LSLAILFHFLCAPHVSDINISIIRSFRLCCWITTLVFCSWFVVCWRFGAQQISNTQRTEKKPTDVVIQQHSRKLLMMDILMSETCWAHKKWNKIASDMKLIFYSSTIFKLFACNKCRNSKSLLLYRIATLNEEPKVGKYKFFVTLNPPSY